MPELIVTVAAYVRALLPFLPVAAAGIFCVAMGGLLLASEIIWLIG